MKFRELTDAYFAIHTLRKFFDDYSCTISSRIEVKGQPVSPVAMLHDQIQSRFLEAWLRYGSKPFTHGEKIVYWDHNRQTVSTVDIVESDAMPDSICD